MLVMIGAAVVLLGVVGGFVLEGGPVLILLQPAELLIIGGAAAGSLLIGTPLKVLRPLAARLPQLLRGGGVSPATYQELLTLLYEIFVSAKKNGFIGLDQDVSDPQASPLFAKYPAVLSNPHATAFLSDSLRLLVDGSVTPGQLEELMDAELETHCEEAARGPGVLARTADSLPGLGIVAAVLGVVITMQAIDGPPSEIGHKVAVALVGTFLGILLCYGFVGPLASALQALADDEARMLHCIKAAVLAFASGSAPIVAAEFGRRVLFSYDRPSGAEMEAAFKRAGTP